MTKLQTLQRRYRESNEPVLKQTLLMQTRIAPVVPTDLLYLVVRGTLVCKVVKYNDEGILMFDDLSQGRLIDWFRTPEDATDFEIKELELRVTCLADELKVTRRRLKLLKGKHGTKD